MLPETKDDRPRTSAVQRTAGTLRMRFRYHSSAVRGAGAASRVMFVGFGGTSLNLSHDERFCSRRHFPAKNKLRPRNARTRSAAVHCGMQAEINGLRSP